MTKINNVTYIDNKYQFKLNYNEWSLRSKKQMTEDIINNRPKIIVVDDETTVLTSVDSMLGEMFNLFLFTQGYEALHFLRNNYDTDILLLDLSMPHVNGFQILRSISVNERLSAIPIILMSSSKNKSDVTYGLSEGASDYILKPFTFELLISRVSKHLFNRFFCQIRDNLTTFKERDIDIMKHTTRMTSLGESLRKKLVDMQKQNTHVKKEIDWENFNNFTVIDEAAISAITNEDMNGNE